MPRPGLAVPGLGELRTATGDEESLGVGFQQAAASVGRDAAQGLLQVLGHELGELFQFCVAAGGFAAWAAILSSAAHSRSWACVSRKHRPSAARARVHQSGPGVEADFDGVKGVGGPKASGRNKEERVDEVQPRSSATSPARTPQRSVTTAVAA